MPGRDANLRSTGAAPGLDELSRAAMGGDGAALARLHERLTPGLGRHFARKLGSGAAARSDEADELAQRTWIAFWEAVRDGKYDPSRARLTTFLYAVAQLVWMRWRRERTRGGADPAGVVEDAADGAGTLPDVVDLSGMLDAVRAVMSGAWETDLTESDRQVLRGIASGRTDRELAEEMGVSASTAHGRKKSALQKLAGILGNRGGGTGPGRAPRGAGA